jgi:carboxypeptidase PM20D1
MPARSWLALKMFRDLGAFLPLSMRFVFANTWLFSGLVRKRLGANPQVNALQRTSTAVTVIRGGVKDNVLPASARALVNFRMLPGDRLEHVLEHIRKVVKDDAVQINPMGAGCWEASPVSSSDSPVFNNLSRTIRQVFPDALVSPYLVLGATDSRHYCNLSAEVFRFSPYRLDSQLLNSIHGIDERIGVDNLAQMVQFYGVLIQSWTAPQAG